jgi:hypothetical protein
MFSEKIAAPLPASIEAGLAPEPLLESARFMEIQADFDASEKSYEDAVKAAYQAAGLIRKYIEFSDHTADQPELTPEWIGESHKTNCHGHSIVASECLERLGIEHFIGFANQHSFVLMQDAVTGQVDLIDTPVEKLCIDITPALGTVALHGRTRGDQGGADHLQGHTILALAPFSDKYRALARRPWLSFLARKNDNYFLNPNDESQKRAGQLMMRSYEPKRGRAVLLSYDSFVHATLRRDVVRSHEWLQDLDGTYPDIDRRNNLRAPTRLVRAFGLRALVDEALGDIAIIESSLQPFTNDLILRLWPADERRRLGVKMKSAEIIQQTLESYDEIYETRDSEGGSTVDIEARIRKARSQLNRIIG